MPFALKRCWIAGFIAVTALGLLINIVPETARVQGSFSAIGAVWSGINIAVLVIASLICFEKPRRLFQAFKLDEPAIVDGTPRRVANLSWQATLDLSRWATR